MEETTNSFKYVDQIKSNTNFRKFRSYLPKDKNKLAILVILVLAIPFTVILALTQQDLFSRANFPATPATPPTSSSNNFNTALEVTDTSGFVRLSDSGSSIGPFDTMTIEALVHYVPTQNNIDYPIVAKGFNINQQETMPFNFNITKDGYLSFIYTVQYQGRWAHTEIRSNSTIDSFGFHHVAVVYNDIQGSVDQGKIFLLIDGKVDKVQQQTGQIAGGSRQDVTIGYFNSSKFSGEIDEVRISTQVRYFTNQIYTQLEPFKPNGFDDWGIYSFDGNLNNKTGVDAYAGVAEQGNLDYVNSVSSPFIYPELPTPTPTEEPTVSPTQVPTYTPTVAPTAVPTPITYKSILTPIEDAFVSSQAPSTNYGKLTYIQTDASPNIISFLKFNLSGLLGKKIISAKLILKINNGAGPIQTLRRADDTVWSEKELNYNNRPKFVSKIVDFSAKGVEKSVEINITNSVNAKKGSNLTIGITSLSTDDIARFYSRESSASNRPTLVIEYQ